MPFVALVPAAGSGTRLPGERPKQYLALRGKPMIWHAVRAVCMPPVEKVFVVLAAGDAEFDRHDWDARVVPLRCGGRTRHESVRNGLEAAQLEADDWVLVHDAARPCLSAKDFDALVNGCRDDQVGGILALPVADTVKRAAGSGRIAATEDRRALWLAQTPQMFRAGVLGRALREATAEATDEAAAVEGLGLQPKLVAGSRDNIKVTWPEDLAIAEAILERR